MKPIKLVVLGIILSIWTSLPTFADVGSDSTYERESIGIMDYVASRAYGALIIQHTGLFANSDMERNLLEVYKNQDRDAELAINNAKIKVNKSALDAIRVEALKWSSGITHRSGNSATSYIEKKFDTYMLCPKTSILVQLGRLIGDAYNEDNPRYAEPVLTCFHDFRDYQ